jgi:hypothetical protein
MDLEKYPNATHEEVSTVIARIDVCAFVYAKNMLLMFNMCQFKSAIHTGND